MTNDSDQSTPPPEPMSGPDRRTWIERDLPLARGLGRPVREFLHVEAAGGVVLLAATVAALVLANTGWGGAIERFWETELLLVEIGDFHLEETLGHWVNDGLMAVFFFVVGLEIKHELVNGELRDPRRAALPAIAAIGGMLVPAGLYAAVTVGGAGASGWGIPMATDIAFAVGVLALLGSRVPAPLKVFLLTLAIVDDIGAILVIAIFYSDEISFQWLLAAGGLIVLIVALRLGRVWYTPIYVVIGIGVWVAFLESGVHATIAGVILGLLTPAKPLRPSPTEVQIDSDTSWSTIRATIFDARESIPVAQRLQRTIHPWSAFVILPVFAFANAGIKLTADSLGDALGSPVTLGVVLGLVVGKPVGITAAAWLAARIGAGEVPDGVAWRHIIGAGMLAGIGFTVSLFVTGLAFADAGVIDAAKIGIIAASAVAAGLGVLILMSGNGDDEPVPTGTPSVPS